MKKQLPSTMKKRLLSILNFFGWCAAFVAVVALAAVLTAARLYSDYGQRAARFDLTKIGEVPERSAVYDANGEVYSYLRGENRLVVPLRNVSKHFINALLAREDARFWEHQGIDLRGIVRAAATNFRTGETKQGASTITQQLARNALQLRGKNLDRKALEAVLAQRIEKTYNKGQILELYVNRIYFGSGFHGIETAARGYFAKPAAELTLGESALLAGLIRSPTKLSPIKDLEAAQAERNAVLDRMMELQRISAEEAAAARSLRETIARRSTMRFEDDYVMDAVTRELTSLLAPEVIDFGGLKIYMTIDPQLQRMAEASTDRRMTGIEEQKNFPHPKKSEFVAGPDDEGKEKPTDYLQATLVAVDNRTGAIRAIVGGRDYAQSKYSRALLSKRQIGSTFKPFVYGEAFQRGLLPGTLIDDSKIAPGEFRDISSKWSPENSDGEYSGLQPAWLGLLKSRNTMTIRIGEYAGLRPIRSFALSAGIGEAMPELPAAFLGAFETTLKDLTAAYTVFPNLGVFRPPHLIARVEDRDGQILWTAPQTEKRVLNAEPAWLVSVILQHVMKTGTAAKSASLGWKKAGAGKTGTTNEFFDAWFVGYTSSITCGVWVGMDKPQTILEKGYGSALALPVWVDFMKQLPEKTYPAQPFEPPIRLVTAQLCAVSGMRATAGCAFAKSLYEAPLPVNRVPGDFCATHPQPPPAMPAPAAPTPYATAAPPPAASVSAGNVAPQATVIASASASTAAPPPALVEGATLNSPGMPAPTAAVAGAPAPRPLGTVIGLDGPPIRSRFAAAATVDTAPPPVAERTWGGTEIVRQSVNHRIAAVPLQSTRSRKPATQVRVMRAIPIEPSVERIERIERIASENGKRRIIRVRPTEPIYREVPRRGLRILNDDDDGD